MKILKSAFVSEFLCDYSGTTIYLTTLSQTTLDRPSILLIDFILVSISHAQYVQYAHNNLNSPAMLQSDLRSCRVSFNSRNHISSSVSSVVSATMQQ